VLNCYSDVPHSRLIVLDTEDIEQGPVTSVLLPVRLRGAVHGSWVDEAALAAVGGRTLA
jgi:carotenoid cleavage dioxygenase-like enzyme